MKVCPRCKQELPLSDFAPVHGRGGDGRRAYDRKCEREKSVAQRKSIKAYKLSRKPSALCRADQLPIPSVRNAIGNGAHTREQIAEATQLTFDQIGEALVVLLLEERQIFSKDRKFYLTKAA